MCRRSSLAIKQDWQIGTCVKYRSTPPLRQQRVDFKLFFVPVSRTRCNTMLSGVLVEHVLPWQNFISAPSGSFSPPKVE